MDNWVFLFLGLILAYSLEFTRPWVKSYFEKNSLTIRQRRIYTITKRYRHISRMKENPAYFNLNGFVRLAWGMIFLVVLLMFYATTSIAAFDHILDSSNFPLNVWFYEKGLDFFFLDLAGIAALSVIGGLLRDTNTILGFDKYKAKTVGQLKKLGGNPEDLDKETTS